MNLKSFFLSLFLSIFSMVAHAQEGLHVESLFEGEIIPFSEMQQATIRGPQLNPYKLSLYRSIRFKTDANVFRTVEQLVLKDAETADDLRSEMDGGHLVYAVITATPLPSGENRFLCFQATPQKDNWYVTLIYLRGTAKVQDLDKMFNKKSH